MGDISKRLRSSMLWAAIVVPFLVLFSWHNSPVPNSLVSRRVASTDLLSSSEVLSRNATTELWRRDDYSCGPGKPCANGACCGASGYCGYGDTYCGKGCVSNCGAHAECGQYAIPAGKTCPLNTCCSQYGFCGTTSDFCTNKCQSNCVEHPSPPGGGVSNGALSKVVGYYESWASRLSCHKVQPEDLPLNAMTHLNYAFAYIDPSSLKLVTMDGDTPADLFSQTTRVKKYNPALQVFISVGGWTFSDNGTATQPLFGQIARSASSRTQFANNVLSFCETYGFDGIDIDWEYPGAPDRGGSTDDTANYVLLVQTLRSVFNSSPRKLGITFTAPSSYWYLRWFDIPGLLKYADWLNFMTYDLHGVWDRNNPIGSIVQAHTNLTEIKLATELLWRVGTPPGKVVLGYGFYGRSFQLSSASCSTPGCQFKGGAAPGPCSATSGILDYYEIMALMSQTSGLNPVWDKTAAVKYLVYNTDQWIAYDDADTFKQKVAWANSVGVGGALIWAADTDDNHYSAMSALTGKDVAHVDLKKAEFSADSVSIAQNLIGQNGQDCTYIKQCVDPNKTQCPSGMTKLGWDHDQGDQKTPCKDPNQGWLICCPSKTAPKSCTWRGGGADCNGQCHPGESTLFLSKHGGGFQSESGGPHRCNRGVQAFCCLANDWAVTTKGCKWKCSCKSSEKSVSSATVVNGYYCPNNRNGMQYCCPQNTPLHDCVWRGSISDCPDAKCKSNEVSIALSDIGDNYPRADYMRCAWGRQRTDCCQVSTVPAKPLSCSANLCDLVPGICSDPDNTYLEKRGEIQILDKRAGRDFPWWLVPIAGQAARRAVVTSRPYIDRNRVNTLLRQQVQGFLRDWFSLPRPQPCGRPALFQGNMNGVQPPTGQIEHALPLLLSSRYLATVNWGRLPDQTPRGASTLRGGPRGNQTTNAAVNTTWFDNVFFNETALAPNLPRYPSTSPDLRNPSQRFMEAFGSTNNFLSFTILEDAINGAKGRIENFVSPMAPSTIISLATTAVQNDDQTAFDQAIAPLREVIGVFNYVNAPDVSARTDQIAANVFNTLRTIEQNTPGNVNLSGHWNEFYPFYYGQIGDWSRTWMQNRINDIRNVINCRPAGLLTDSFKSTLDQLESSIPDLKYPQAN